MSRVVRRPVGLMTLSSRTLRNAAVFLAVVVAGVGLTAPATAAGAAPGQEAEPPGRVLLISVPGLTWAEVQEHDLPAIEGLLAGSGLADLAPRGVSPQATPGAAYLTMSAGSRATSEDVVDGQQLALADQSAGSAAGEIFERRTGTRPDGNFVALAWPALMRANARQPYDAELGLLTDTLAEAGIEVAAIGNADGSDTLGPSFERQVGLAVVNGEGVVPAGELGTDLLVDDPASPFGLRLDPDQVMQRFDDAWGGPDGDGQDAGLVLVEASDLARTMRYRDRVDSARYEQMRTEALEDTDALVGRLLDQVDPARDAVLLVGPYNLRRDRDLTVAALQAPGVAPGYLRSASTQRSGFLTLVDIAPTVLDLLDVERPVAMEGRPAEGVASSDDLDERVEQLVTFNAASRFRERLLFPTTLAVVLTLAVICAVAAVMIARRSPRAATRWVCLAALTDLAVLPMSYLARAFPLEDLGAGFYWAFIVVGALAAALGATALATCLGRPRVALVSILGLVIAVLVADVMTGSNLSLNAAFGYSPTGNSRLYGISNYSFGQVAGASCLLAAMLAALDGRGLRSRWGALALLVAMLVVIGVPIWGSDVGGVLAFTPTVLLFVALVWQGRIRLRHFVLAGVATLVAVTVFGLLDLARPPEQRAHLGRLFERIGDEGSGPLLDIMERKFLANMRVSTSSFWIAAIPVAVLFLIFLARYPSRPLAALVRERIPTLRAGLSAAGLAAVLGSLVNDSGAIVAGVTLMVVAASLAYLTLEPAPTPRLTAPAGTGVVADADAGGEFAAAPNEHRADTDAAAVLGTTAGPRRGAAPAAVAEPAPGPGSDAAAGREAGVDATRQQPEPDAAAELGREGDRIPEDSATAAPGSAITGPAVVSEPGGEADRRSVEGRVGSGAGTAEAKFAGERLPVAGGGDGRASGAMATDDGPGAGTG